MTNLRREYEVCQYWRENKGPCSYWDAGNIICTYVGDPDPGSKIECFTGVDYPFCNLLGTSATCIAYNNASTTKTSRCMLPDPDIGKALNPRTGAPYVHSPTASTTPDPVTGKAAAVSDWTFTDITHYNSGQCDSEGKGTEGACSGYSPQKLGFSDILPTTATGVLTKVPGLYALQHHLPADYVVMNIRAQITPCYWWEGDIHEYTLDPNTGYVRPLPDGTSAADGASVVVAPDDSGWEVMPQKIAAFDTKCTYAPSSTVEPFISGGDANTFQYKCNGCSTSCPKYTGPCWMYANDDLLIPGKGILAEQVLELRWMARKDNWTEALYNSHFDNSGSKWAWKGSLDVSIAGSTKLNHVIHVNKTFISDFKHFSIDYIKTTTTKGTKADDRAPEYPDLITQFYSLLTEPIIRNKFEVDSQDNSNNAYGSYYESSSLYSPDVYIYGDAPTNGPSYVVNLALGGIKALFPNYAQEYNNSFELSVADGVSDADRYTFYKELDEVIQNLLANEPLKIRQSLTGQDKHTFIINIDTQYGSNEVIVLNKVGTQWRFAKKIFDMLHVGGQIRQRSYTIEGDNKSVFYGPNYESGNGSTVNDNAVITFDFDPIISSGWSPEVSYYYNDYDFQQLQLMQWWKSDMTPDQYFGRVSTSGIQSNDNSHISGYILYEKLIKKLSVTPEEVVQLNSGHIVLTLKHSSLTNAIFAWLPSNIKVIYYDAVDPTARSTCEFNIVVHGGENEMLAPNQVIIYPKDMTDFRSICLNGANPDDFFLEDVSTYHKRSFDDDPVAGDDEELNAVSLHQDQAYSLGIEMNDGVIRKFDTTVHMSAVLKGRSGREFCSIKTLFLQWIKQPMCPDVEIKYEWLSNYRLYETYPRCRCEGENGNTYLTTNITSSWFDMPAGVSVPYSEYREPFCGDHDVIKQYKGDLGGYIGANNKIGAMWWPYIQCDGYQNYHVITNQDYSALEIMTEFAEEDKGVNEYTHGQHDLRMLGPDWKLAWTGQFCPAPRACSCGKQHFNGVKRGNRNYSRFTGYGSIRSGVTYTQLGIWNEDTSWTRQRDAYRTQIQWPGFGNSSRPLLRSYRTNHRLQYYLQDIFEADSDKIPTRLWKYIPAWNEFSFTNFTSRADKMFNDYSSSLGVHSVNTLGMVLFNGIDGGGSKESLDDAYYTYNEVFRNHGEYDDIFYPAAQGSYARSSFPWLDFKENIQWAWQLPWPSPDRASSIITISGSLNTIFSCLSINYPSYQYNYTLEEVRYSPVSGTHNIYFKAPEMDDAGLYTENASLQLDGGPEHYFNFTDGWLDKKDDDALDDSIYSLINGHRTSADKIYYNNITLAESDEEIELYLGLTETPSGSEKTYRYGFKGLAVSIYGDFMYTLPQKTWPLDGNSDYEIALVSASVEGSNNISFSFDFAETKRRIGKFTFTCAFGCKPPAVLTDNGIPIVDDDNNIVMSAEVRYHVPSVTVYAQLSDGSYYLINSGGSGMTLTEPGTDLTTKTVEETFKLPPNYLWSGGTKLLAVFRGDPTVEELTMNNLDPTTYPTNPSDRAGYVNFVSLGSFVLEDSALVNGHETINVYERKYRVSRAGTDEDQPQGTGAERLLFAPLREVSTVYQRDNREGLTKSEDIEAGGVFVPNETKPNTEGVLKFRSKCRSRFLYPIEQEMTPLKIEQQATTIYDAESRVKEMYDLATSEEPITMSATHFILPEVETVMNASQLRFESGGSTSLTMTNTFVAPLSSLVAHAKYSPAGHAYVPSNFMKTSCGDTSFTYVYAQVEDAPNVTEIHDILYSGTTDPDDRDGEWYSTHVTLARGQAGTRGFGEIYYPPSDQDTPGYQHYVNERTKFAQGKELIQDRKSIAAFLYHSVYPKVFTRYTQHKAFADELTELSMPPTLARTPCFDFSGGPMHPDADTARYYFWLVGGFAGKRRDPDTGQWEDFFQ